MKINKFHKPQYKSLTKRRENIHYNKKKIFLFYKKKWELFQAAFEKNLRYDSFEKTIKQGFYSVVTIAKRGNSYKKFFRNRIEAIRKLKIVYGKIKIKHFKKILEKSKKVSIYKRENKYRVFTHYLEKRLDTILCMAGFCTSTKEVRQFIKHKKVFVNNLLVNSYAFELKKGDLISFKDNNIRRLISKNFCLRLERKNFFPQLVRHFYVNYKTLQIIYGDIEMLELYNLKTNNLNLEKIIG